MKHFSASKIALMLAFASQIQGSAMVEQAPASVGLMYKNVPLVADRLYEAVPNLHLNGCINAHFGNAINDNSMLGAIYEAPMGKVIDAFIECPDVMSIVYHDKIILDGADDLLSALTAAKTARFYEALRSVVSSPASHPQSVTAVKAIYKASLMKGIRWDLYMDDMSLDSKHCIGSLTEFALKSTDKDELRGFLRTEMRHLRLSGIESTGEAKETQRFIEFMDNLFNNKEASTERMNDSSKLNALYLALSLNRYTLADRTVGLMKKNTAIALDAIEFIKNVLFDRINEPKRAFRIVAELFESIQDKTDFEQVLSFL